MSTRVWHFTHSVQLFILARKFADLQQHFGVGWGAQRSASVLRWVFHWVVLHRLWRVFGSHQLHDWFNCWVKEENNWSLLGVGKNYRVNDAINQF